MSERDAFLANIRDNADDDTARLVYADWLQEHGEDDRAEFIRVQVELARGDLDAPQRPELRRRERELWLTHGSAWLAELPVVRGFEWAGFRRGLPAHLQIVRWDASLTDACQIAPVCELSSESNDRAHDPTQLFQSPEIRAIRRLDLPSGGWGDPDVASLLTSGAFHGLIGLNLRHNPVATESANVIASAPQLASLRELGLPQNSLTAAAAVTLIRSENLASLRWLDISGCPLGDEGARSLAAEPGLKRLTGLGLSFCRIEPDGIQALADSPNLGGLQILDVTFNSGVDVTLTLLNRCPELIALDFGNHSVTADDLPELFARATQGQLRYLRLAGNNLEGFGIADVRRLSIEGLVELDLQDTQLGDEGIEALSRVQGLSGLHRLSIGGNDLGDAALIALAAADLSNLGVLIAFTNRIGVEGVRALAASPTLGKLSQLDLSHNPLDDEAAFALAESDHLQRLILLDLQDTRVTEKGVNALLNSPKLPNLKRVNLNHREAEQYGMAIGPRYLMEWEI